MKDVLLEKLHSSWLKDDYGHIISDDNLELDTWQAQGKPHIWILSEQENDYQVYTDVGYGNMCLFKGTELLGYGTTQIITNDIVVMDRGYYGTKKYIFK